MAVDINSKINLWKNKLLDIGKRNRLINYHETKRSTLRIITPEIYTLWNSFVQDEKSLEFPFYDDVHDEQELNVPAGVETNQPVCDMQKTLRNLRDKAKTANEEQGINVLYLSFGFLEWNEADNTEQIFRSPLILVPVTLKVESITSPFVLSLHEDEILVNPTLQYKLENDFAITLPDFNEDDDIKEYFSSVSLLVSRNGWKVAEETSLGLLSFLKINMYNDLSQHKDTIINNPVIRAISGDSSACESIPQEINNYDFDKSIKPIDAFQVVDADSSQLDAILCAKKGYSFVLQGPPGTGKSQTITNIISECLADGKKVLFVSEKMAALDVVYRRLTSAGLNDFCMVLHSYKANKKAVLEQLETVLNLSKNKAQLSDEAYLKLDTLEKDREKLNEYAGQLHTKINPLGKTIYEVNGILANLNGYEDVIFPVNNIDRVDWNKYCRYINVLNDYINSIGKMSEDFTVNPWYGANIQNVSNELRHDVGANLPKLAVKLSNYNSSINNMLQTLSLNMPVTYNCVDNLISVLEAAKCCPVVPVDWIVGEEITPLLKEIEECENIKADFIATENELKSHYDTVTDINHSITFSDAMILDSADKITDQRNYLAGIIQSMPVLSAIYNTEDYNKLIEENTQVKDKTDVIIKNKNNVLKSFDKEIFDIDYNAVLVRYRTQYSSVFKCLKASYKADKKLFKSLYKNLSVKISDDIIIGAIENLKEIATAREWLCNNASCFKKIFYADYKEENSDFKNIEDSLALYKAIIDCVVTLDKLYEIVSKNDEMESKLISHYSFLYKGINTSWETVRKSLAWSITFRKLCDKNKLGKLFVEKVCSDKEFIDLCAEYNKQLCMIKQDIDVELVWFLKMFDDTDIMRTMEFIPLMQRIKKCSENLFLLEEWIDFRNARISCNQEGLGQYVSKIEEQHISPECIIPIFKKRFYRLWLDAVLPEYPAILNFRRVNQDKTIQEFAALDKIQFEIAKARIKSMLINGLPSFDMFTNGGDEIGILKRELTKRRRIMPIRKLFKQIPNLLPTLKPCMMMSPLSVSLFLEADTYQFDTVIFDEASQVCTENAIGAISRGKQVVIAGDSKQLPPTNFFGASLSDEDYDNEDENEDEDSYESVLDEANLLPERTLLWHYRSRHEHLIAFSNAKIYNNQLITFPSNVDKIPDTGVEYEYVSNGYYDRGGKKGNVIEAQRVAEIVFENLRKYPDRSIGVIAFGEVQQQAIDTAIRKMRMQNQNYESFFNEDKEEPFFVKNLENVQGDERDTIIFSIGYAKDVNGIFRMNFGPLSKVGGERRLNVAITRAKYNIKLVGSVLPTDIDVDKISTDGPKLLRDYIDFAINGVASLHKEIPQSEVSEYDSSFEKAVYDFLDSKGYKLAKQVGCSGYRIDIAVKHPELNGQYVLGIECDGDSYHFARIARERDRLRQCVLEQMGWKMYRVWSTDWIKDSVNEGEKLIAVIEEALKGYHLKDKQNTSEQSVDADDFVSIGDKKITEEGNPYGFEQEKVISFAQLPRDNEGYYSVEDCIMEVVNKKYPVHYELLCKELAPLFGYDKATVKVKREIDSALGKLGNSIIQKGNFIYPSGYETIIPHPIGNTRTIDFISCDELAEAMLKVATAHIGITMESLFSETAKVYGFSRVTAKIKDTLQQACNMLVNNSRAEEVAEKFLVKKD